MRFTFTKRKKIIFLSLLLGLALFLVENAGLPLWACVAALVVVSYGATVWILDFDLKPVEYVIFPFLSVAFSIAIALIAPILDKLSLLPIVFPMYIFGTYVLFLTLNILNISTIKPLPLVKAAWTSLHIWHFTLSFLLFGFLFWFHFSPWIVFIASFFITFFLSWPGFYLLIHELGRGGNPFLFMSFTALIIGELSWIISFWPFPFYASSLMLAASFYIITGILEHQLRATLSKIIVWEYAGIVFLSIVLILSLLVW